MLSIGGKQVFTTLEELVNPEYTALLLVDIQNDYAAPGGYFDGSGQNAAALRQIVPRVKAVLEAARHAHVMVVHIQLTRFSDYRAESPASLRSRLLRVRNITNTGDVKLTPYCIDNTWGWQPVAEIAPLPGEFVVKKHRASAFIGTDLDTILRSNGIKSVLVAGLVSHGCVMATANDAVYLDYYPIVLRDCVASQKKELHDAALLIMSELIDVADSKDVIKIWKSKAI